MTRSDVPPALRTLLEVGGALLRRSSNGRVLLGRTAGLVTADALPPPLRGLEATLAQARAEASRPLAAKTVERALRDAWRRLRPGCSMTSTSTPRPPSRRSRRSTGASWTASPSR